MSSILTYYIGTDSPNLVTPMICSSRSKFWFSGSTTDRPFPHTSSFKIGPTSIPILLHLQSGFSIKSIATQTSLRSVQRPVILQRHRLLKLATPFYGFACGIPYFLLSQQCRSLLFCFFLLTLLSTPSLLHLLLNIPKHLNDLHQLLPPYSNSLTAAPLEIMHQHLEYCNLTAAEVIYTSAFLWLSR
ncbi:hypothetical protein ACSQ67_016080 [Phaseolus vulgaris]